MGATGPAIEQFLVEGGAFEDLALKGRDSSKQAGVRVGERLLDRLAGRAFKERGELHELEVADDSMRDVYVCVKTELAKPATDAGDAVEQLLAHRAKRRFDELVCVRRTLCRLLPVSVKRLAKALDIGVWVAAKVLTKGERVSDDDTSSAFEQLTCVAKLVVGDGSGDLRCVARIMWLACPQSKEIGVLEAGSDRRTEADELDRAGFSVRRRPWHVEGVGTRLRGDERVRKLTRMRRREATLKGVRDVLKPRFACSSPSDVSGSAERTTATDADAVEEVVKEVAGRHPMHRSLRLVVERQEALDPFPRLRRHLWRLERRRQRSDDVKAAPPGDLDDLGEVDVAHLDRRTEQRPGCSARIVGIDENAEPRNHVPDLSPSEDGGRTVNRVRDCSFFKRSGERCALCTIASKHDRELLRRNMLTEDEPLDVSGNGKRLRPLIATAPEAHIATSARKLTESGCDDRHRHRTIRL
jgi:hypothetical protein